MQCRRQHRPAVDGAHPRARVDRREDASRRDNVGGVGCREVDRPGAVGARRRHQEPDQVVDVHDVHRTRSRGAQQGCHRPAHQRVGLPADGCRDPDDQGRRPAGTDEVLGLLPCRGHQQRQRGKDHPGAAASGGVADPYQIGGPDTGTVGGQRQNHVGVGGQVADDAVSWRGADEVDAGVEVAVRPQRHTRDLMPRCQQALSERASQPSADLREQDPHSRPYFPHPLRRA